MSTISAAEPLPPSFTEEYFEPEKNKDAPAKKPPKKVTADVAKMIAALIPAIEKGKLSKVDAAKKCELPISTFSSALEKLQNEGKFTYRRPPKKVTATAVSKVKERLEQINSGELSRKDAALKCNLSLDTLKSVVAKLNEGEDPLQSKPQQKVTDATVKKVKEVLFQTEEEEPLSKKALAEKCQIHPTTFSRVLKDLEENKNPVRPRPKIVSAKFEGLTEKIKANRLARKVKELLPKIKAGELTQKAAADKLEISETAFQETIEKLQKEAVLYPL